jgi:hypothetical protein
MTRLCIRPPKPTAHTPGPWATDKHGNVYPVSPPDGWDALLFLTQGFGREQGEVQANARLIALAPEMAEGLRTIRAWIMDARYNVPAPGKYVGLIDALLTRLGEPAA